MSGTEIAANGQLTTSREHLISHLMTTTELLEFMRTQRLGVQTSVGAGGVPQAALVGVAVTDSLELVFDTLATTRKLVNLRRNPRLAFVIGGWAHGDERTVQYQGTADEPQDDELARVKEAYFAAWPDGRLRQTWPGLVYVRVRPMWIRYSDFNQRPPMIAEFDEPQLSAAAETRR
ncbi:MAG TPA: pyridoxamine 5'-phosphate oxidase family protein [Gemmatimonadaceae bacterium]